MTDQTLASHQVTGPVQLWFRDPLSCLQATMATVLLRQGEDPLAVLGLCWEFLYLPGDVRPEEFYYPCRYSGDVAHSMAPYHPIHSEWWRPADTDDPLREIAGRLDRDQLMIAAVDNYYLPFRPAFHDVHAAHLLVVYGLDRERGTIRVSDAMPPAFQGNISVDEFTRSWSSGNPADFQDAFFSDAGIGRRCLEVRLAGPLPPVDRQVLRSALDANVQRFATGAPAGATGAPAGWSGLHGLRRYLDELTSRSQAGDSRVLAEAYAFGWPVQAQCYLHGELLTRLGAQWGIPALREAGRAVASVGYAWTGLRMTAAHGRVEPSRDHVEPSGDDGDTGVAAALAAHGRRLRRRYETAVESIEHALEIL
ncbi:MAG: BtrH N-terminal domain-containing protein [Trebonia sp.]